VGSIESTKALLGYRFLSQFKLTIDYFKDTVTLSPNADAAFPTNTFHTGLALASERDHSVVVRGIWGGSPADKMGIKVGERVLEINGKPAASYDQVQLSEMTSNPEVKELRLVLERQGRRFEIALAKANLFP
jgi:S1-C subfamily serine protease